MMTAEPKLTTNHSHDTQRWTGFLADLPSQDRNVLLTRGETLAFSEDETVIRQGQVQEDLYTVLEGTLQVRCCSPYSVVELGLLSSGDCFGEMSVLDPLKASASIKGIQSGTLWKISCQDFHEYLSNHPQAGIKILTHFGVQLTRRVRKSEDRLLRSSERPVGFDYDY